MGFRYSFKTRALLMYGTGWVICLMLVYLISLCHRMTDMNSMLETATYFVNNNSRKNTNVRFKDYSKAECPPVTKIVFMKTHKTASR